MWSSTEHEVGFVNSFVLRERRTRYLELLAKPKHRTKVLERFDHSPGLEPKYCLPISPAGHSPADLERLLRGYGAPEQAYLLSSRRSLDARFLALRDALDQVVAQGMGTVVSCIPGVLAYYEGEDAGERCVLRRDAR